MVNWSRPQVGRARRLWASLLGTAGLLGGQLLFAGDELPASTPQAVVNQYLQSQSSALPAGKPARLAPAAVQAVSTSPLGERPTAPAPVAAETTPMKSKPAVQPAVAAEELAPIVPAWAMKTKGAQTSERRTQRPAGLVNADFEGRLLQQPGLVQPPPAPGVAADEGVFGVLPPGAPFEAIRESGEILIRVRRSMLLRTKVDVYRTAIVD